jgi:hypothetical protein
MNCERCGIEMSREAIEKRIRRGKSTELCVDCNMKPAKEIKYNGQPCRPWRGEVDDDWNPIDDKGNLYRPGPRSCGNKDCVNAKHIIKTFTMEELESERLDISYRTGKKFDLVRVMREVY